MIHGLVQIFAKKQYHSRVEPRVDIEIAQNETQSYYEAATVKFFDDFKLKYTNFGKLEESCYFRFFKPRKIDKTKLVSKI